MSENENKASRGSVAQIILTTLSSGDKYGYEIIKQIEELSNGELVLKQPSLYSSLRRMEEQGLIASYWEDSDIGGKRHYYSLTDAGKARFEENRDEWQMKNLINNLPTNDESFDNVKESNKGNFQHNTTAVASQENLFSLAKKNDEKAKKIVENEQDSYDEENNSFVQFDLFDQNAKVVKKANVENVQSPSIYENKFEDMDNHEFEIEKKSNLEPDTEPIENQFSIDDSLLNSSNYINDDFEEKNEKKWYEFKDDFTPAFSSQDKNLNKTNLELEKNEPDLNDLNASTRKFVDDDFISRENNSIENTNEINFDNHTNKSDSNEILNDFNKIVTNPFAKEDDEEVFKEDVRSNFDLNELFPTSNADKEETTNENEKVLDVNMLNTEKKEENIKNDEVLTNKQSSYTDFEERQNLKSKNQEKDDSDLFNSSTDYKMVIGQLYNNSQLSDPYEQNKFRNFKEIFPTTKVTPHVKQSPDGEIASYIKENSNSNDDISNLNKAYEHQGIKIKKHTPVANNKNNKEYTDVNKLNMYVGIITAIIMLIETITCYIVLKNTDNITQGQYMIYFLSVSTAICVAIVTILENFFDRFKLIKLTPNFKKGFIIRTLIFIFALIFIFIIFSLFLGLRDLSHPKSLSFWLVPALLASNLIVSYFIYFLLLKSKNFNS